MFSFLLCGALLGRGSGIRHLPRARIESGGPDFHWRLARGVGNDRQIVPGKCPGHLSEERPHERAHGIHIHVPVEDDP